jgi:hypothetical protein
VSTVIRLDLMLREAVATPYRDLVTRPTGAAVRHRVLDALRDTSSADAQLDFSEVGLMDFSCADEVIAKLLVETLDLPLQRLMLRGVSENHADAIEHALVRYDLVIVAILTVSPEPRLLGSVPEDWRAAFRALTQLGRAAAAPIADALSWPVLRAVDALDGLARRRCVVAHPDATWELGAVA